MGFGDLQSRDGLVLLNNFLNDKSYIEGSVDHIRLNINFSSSLNLSCRYRPTQGDVVVFEAVKKAPAADLENALRWYNHIASFSDGEKQKSVDHRIRILIFEHRMILDSKVNENRLINTVDIPVKIVNKNSNSNLSRSIQTKRKPQLLLMMTMMSIFSVKKMKKKVNKPKLVLLLMLKRKRKVNN